MLSGRCWSCDGSAAAGAAPARQRALQRGRPGGAATAQAARAGASGPPAQHSHEQQPRHHRHGTRSGQQQRPRPQHAAAPARSCGPGASVAAAAAADVLQAGVAVTAAPPRSPVSLAPPIMVNSCTGRMGHAAAEAIVAAGLTLVPFTLTGYSAGVAVSSIGVRGTPVELVGRERRQEVMAGILAQHPDLIVVDYTTPYCVNDNAAFYAANGVPFVMGTTGGNPAAVAAAAEAAGCYAVISPQMGKQVVAFQAVMAALAAACPGAFAGYTLSVVESHQSTKADTSGTAKAIVASLRQLGVADFAESQIRKVRDRVSQLEVMGVPEEALHGHAFHTYTLTAPDGSAQFVFKHNVAGRHTYAEGTVDAVLFLAEKVRERAERKVYSMVDVVRHGSLR